MRTVSVGARCHDTQGSAVGGMLHAIARGHRSEVERIDTLEAAEVVAVLGRVGAALVMRVNAAVHAEPVLRDAGVEPVHAQRVRAPRDMQPRASGTEATMLPRRRHSEQSQRRGSTMPSGRSSSSTTAPQWHAARCLGRMAVGPTCLIMRVPFLMRWHLIFGVPHAVTESLADRLWHIPAF